MITITDLYKRSRKVEAVNGLTLEVPEGQVTAFLGPNGAGKMLGPAQFAQLGYVSENMELPRSKPSSSSNSISRRKPNSKTSRAA